MTRKRGLGRGLDALIPAGGLPAAGGNVLLLPLAQVRPNPRQPRTQFDPQELEELAESIRRHGVLQPVIVTRGRSDSAYLLVAGERRLQAARRAGLETIPAIVRSVTAQQHLELALIENLQRADLNPLEAAEGYRVLADEFEVSHEDIASRVGKSRTAITNTLRLLKLSAPVRQALLAGAISEGHARALLGLSTSQAQAAALSTVLKNGWNVRQTEELVRRLGGERRRGKSRARLTPEETSLVEELRQSLGTRVSLRRGRRGGTLTLRFFSDEELNALVDRLLRGDRRR
ncbi:MAG: ParB/RepB/Spo0J family partition protein [Anaerolineales bacterium]